MKKNPLTFSSLLRTSSISPTRLFNLASLVSMSANPLTPVLLFLSIMLINSSFAWTTTESHVSDQSAPKIKDLSLVCTFSEANTKLIFKHLNSTTESHVSDQSAPKIKDLSLVCTFSEANTKLIFKHLNSYEQPRQN